MSSGPCRYIPLALIVNLRITSTGLRAIERDPDGNRVIRYEGRTADPNLKRAFSVTFDSEGNPLRSYAEADPTTKRGEESYEFEIEPQSPPGLPVVRQRQISPNVLPAKLIDVQCYPQSRPELFSIEAVEALATDARIRMQYRLAQIADSNATSDGSSERAPYVRTRLGRAGWPLIVIGVIVVGLGIIALWRSRAGR
ncbi:MAG: hypothetical protein KJZ65_07375 [Phycisphaerales bacterium]|nr:hypothetical protein [Phycisphaerales bacterium]